MIQRCRHCGCCAGGSISLHDHQTTQMIVWPESDLCPNCIHLKNVPTLEENILLEILSKNPIKTIEELLP